MNTTQVAIHLARLGKAERVYPEGLVSDDGRRLETYSVIPAEFSLRLTEKFQQQGFLSTGQRIEAVTKVFFYRENFTLVAYRDPTGQVLGYYCDIVTLLEKRGADYFLTDLILDLWVWPEGRYIELDRAEFDAARASALISPELAATAHTTIECLKTELAEGRFPAVYLS